jgi:hypothetical protein
MALAPADVPVVPYARRCLQDGAARVLDPIFAYMNDGVKHHGIFFKDYRASPW